MHQLDPMRIVGVGQAGRRDAGAMQIVDEKPMPGYSSTITASWKAVISAGV